MAAQEPIQTHFTSYNGPRRGFLDLPFELRDIIYHQTLIARSIRVVDYGTPTPILMLNPHGRIIVGKKRLRKGYCCFEHRHGVKCQIKGLTAGLLRVSRQVHDEAARYLYSNNEFVVPIGHNSLEGDCTIRVSIDNFIDIPRYYLRMVRKCELRVQLPILKLRASKLYYLIAKRRIMQFADVMHHQDHSLQRLNITLTEWFWRSLRDTFTLQNVLEPLGSIHGVPEVTIKGVRPDFRAKLKKALHGDKAACFPIEERYGVRTIKVKGRKRPQRYKLGRFYDSTYSWVDDCLAGSDSAGGTKPS